MEQDEDSDERKRGKKPRIYFIVKKPLIFITIENFMFQNDHEDDRINNFTGDCVERK